MSRARRWLVPLAAAMLGTSPATAVTPAAAAPEPATGPLSLTLFLKAPDLAGLDQLAGAQGLTHAQRVQAVNSLVPSEATHRQVEDQLRAQGFRVTDETSWSITVTGARATSDALFGTRPTVGRHPSAARVAAATGALPHVPAVLAGVVTAAFPTTGGPAKYKHSAATTTLDGTDFRNADTPATVAASTGANTTGLTIATLQLANFYGVVPGYSNSQTAADLTHYANDHSIADPVTLPAGNPRYQPVKVLSGPDPTADNMGGDIEVNLDQESILSTAPSANQHAYFAPNSDAGFNDVFASVLDDVLGNSHAKLPDPHIVALSSSWGQCESQNTASSIDTLEPILKSLLAAGVTIFSSAGDDGIYDCRDGGNTADVDYPGSSPSVVSIGGTDLSAAAGSAPNSGSNWVETAWSCTSANSCQNGTGGTGGGASSVFAAPAYQKVGIDNAPFKGAPDRLVPDIAADADPATGFVIYTSDLLQSGGQNNLKVGGTSLAAPISAAQLANALGDSGRTSGVGDIHGALYSAYQQTRSLAATDPLRPFRDITVGTNGASTDKAGNPSISAQAGYDTNTGLGAVLWSALLPYLVDTHKPASTGTLSQPHPHTSAWRQLEARWTASRGADTSLLAPSKVKITANGATVFSSSAPSGSKTLNAAPGKTYVLTIVASDISGRTASPVTRTLRMPFDDSAFSFSKHWTRAKNARDFGGWHAKTATKGSAARATATGRTFTLRVLTTRTSGKLGVYLGRTLVKKVNLHSRTAGRRSVTLSSTAARHTRTFTFKALSNALVSIDALDVTY